MDDNNDGYHKINPLPLEEAERALEELVDTFAEAVFHWNQKNGDDSTGGMAPSLGIRATAGLGKTSRIISKLIQSGAIGSGYVQFYVPNHTLSKELEEKLKDKLDLELSEMGKDDYSTVKVIKGRNKSGSSEESLCRKAELSSRLISIGLNVRQNLCSNDSHQCEFFSDCKYLSQFRGEEFSNEEREMLTALDMPPIVHILAHNHLFYQTRLNNLSKPDVVVVDESFYKVGLIDKKMQPTELSTVDSEVCRLIYDVITQQQPLLSILRIRGYTSEGISKEVERLRGMFPVGQIHPGMEQSEQLRALKHSDRYRKLFPLLEGVAWELENCSREHSHVVEFRKGWGGGRDNVHIHRRRELTVSSDIPIIFIDADLHTDILSRFRPDVPVRRLDVDRQAEIHQFSDLTFSKNSLKNDDEKGCKMRRQVSQFIKQIVNLEQETLVICSREIRKKLTGESREEIPQDTQYQGATITHFGILKGLNKYEKYKQIILLGREQASTAALEGDARGLYWDEENEIQWMEEDERGNKHLGSVRKDYRVRGGGEGVSVPVDIHPDKRVQILMEQVRECGSIQAIDRLRLIRELEEYPEVRRVFILSKIPLEISVDYVWRWGDLHRCLSLWEEADGVLPMRQCDLMRRCPESAGSEKKAKKRITKFKLCLPLIKILIRERNILRVEYQSSETGTKYDAYVDGNLDREKIRKSLTEAAGREVFLVRDEEEGG